MKMMLATVLALGASVLSGCTSAGTHPSATRTVTVTATTTVTASPLAAHGTGQANAVGGAMRLGQTYHGKGFTVTTYAYHRDVAQSAPRPAGGAQRWDDADVKVCVVRKSTLSWVPWALIDARSGQYTGSSDIYNQFPQPLYPDGDRLVAAGECARGYIVFPVAESAKIRLVEYSLNQPAVVVDWRV